jgi:hypothetical protein
LFHAQDNWSLWYRIWTVEYAGEVFTADGPCCRFAHGGGWWSACVSRTAIFGCDLPPTRKGRIDLLFITDIVLYDHPRGKTLAAMGLDLLLFTPRCRF